MKYNFATISFFKLLLKGFFLSCLIISISGCAHYKVCTQKFVEHSPNPLSIREESEKHENKKDAAAQRLYRVVPRHRCQIKRYDVGHWLTWMLFGNDNDGIFGEFSHRPYKLNCKNNFKKALSWWIRNPLHNFTFYTIGSAHCVNSKFTILNINRYGICCFHYDPVAKHTFGGPGSSLFIGLHGWKPFFSLRLDYSKRLTSQYYLGWRNRGNFGFKFQPLVKAKRIKRIKKNETQRRRDTEKKEN